MAVMRWEKEGRVARIILDDGENPHNPDFVNELLGILDEIEGDMSLGSVIIGSSDPKFWSTGLDLPWVLAAFGDPERHDDLRAFLYGINEMFKRVLLFPMPVIAAMNGHSFGNGAIFSCACDFRFMRSDRGFFCFPEVDVSIPFLPGMMAIVKKAFPRWKLEELAYSGRRCTATELEEAHVITRACGSEAELMESTMNLAKTFDKARGILGELKRRMNGRIVEIIEKEDPKFIEPLNLIA